MSRTAQQQRERYKYLKSKHCCTICGTKDARTECGRVLCFECADKRAERGRAYDPVKRHEAYLRGRDNFIAREKERAANGQCTRCGASLSRLDTGYKMCGKCRAYKRIHLNNHNAMATEERNALPEKGFCYRCYASLPANNNGHKLCPDCYAKTYAHCIENAALRKAARTGWNNSKFFGG